MQPKHAPMAADRGPVLVAYDGRWQTDELLVAGAYEAERRGRPLSIVTLFGTPDEVASFKPNAPDGPAGPAEPDRRDEPDTPGGWEPRQWTTGEAPARAVAEAGDALARRFTQLPIATHCVPYDQVTAAGELFRSADLLVLGTRDLHDRLAFARGSASGRLLAATSCPVLAFPDAALRLQPELGEGVVVAALSGDTSDAGVGDAAAQEAELRGANLQFVHSFVPSGDEQLPGRVVRVMAGLASSLPAEVTTPGTLSITLTDEVPATALCRATGKAHLLVLGSRAGSLRGDVLGSVSRAVLGAADCPVLVIRKEDALLLSGGSPVRFSTRTPATRTRTRHE